MQNDKDMGQSSIVFVKEKIANAKPDEGRSWNTLAAPTSRPQEYRR